MLCTNVTNAHSLFVKSKAIKLFSDSEWAHLLSFHADLKVFYDRRSYNIRLKKARWEGNYMNTEIN